jgi:hypothetical protein
MQIPPFVPTAITSALGAVFVLRNGTTFVPDLVRLVATQTAMSVMASGYFFYKFNIARRDLRKMGNPTSVSLNMILFEFDDANTMVKMSPAVLLLVAILGKA